jgi:hypothetical protein
MPMSEHAVPGERELIDKEELIVRLALRRRSLGA